MLEGLIPIPADFGEIPPKKHPHLRRKWFVTAYKLWSACVSSGEDPFAAGERIGIETQQVAQWLRRGRTPQSIAETQAAKPSKDALWNEFFRCAPGSMRAQEIMDQIRERSSK